MSLRGAAQAGWGAASPVLGDLLKKGAYVGSAVLAAPLVLSGLRSGLQSAFPQAAAPQTGGGAAPPGGTAAPPSTQPPSQQTFDEQIRILTELLEEKNRQTAEYSQAEQAQTARLIDAIIDPAYYAQRAAIDQANYERMQELGRIAGMEQSRELTRRKIESDTINAWRGITESQLKAQTDLARSMMEVAYRAATPNAAVMQAGANFAQQGAAGFAAPKSLI